MFWKQHGLVAPNFVVLAQGLVPSTQTIHRAELCGVITAANMAAAQHLPVTVHVDASSAMAAVDKFWEHGVQAKVAHKDLLLQLAPRGPG